MSVPETEAIARRFIRAWGVDGAALVDELADPAIRVWYSHFPEPVQGAAAFRRMLEQTLTFFPDLETTADEVIAAGERAVVRWTWTGTHRAGELFGVRPAGRRVRVPGITVYTIRAGRVHEETGVADTFSLMLQVGATAMPGPQEQG